MSERIKPAPDTSDERLGELIRWTSKSGMPDVHALLCDLQQRRAAQAAGADRVRQVVENEIARELMSCSGLESAFADWRGMRIRIANRVASQISAAPLPSRKEWDAARHDRGDTSEADGYESSDYVDGWNDAIDAVEAGGGR